MVINYTQNFPASLYVAIVIDPWDHIPGWGCFISPHLTNAVGESKSYIVQELRNFTDTTAAGVIICGE